MSDSEPVRRQTSSPGRCAQSAGVKPRALIELSEKLLAGEPVSRRRAENGGGARRYGEVPRYLQWAVATSCQSKHPERQRQFGALHGKGQQRIDPYGQEQRLPVAVEASRRTIPPG